MALGDRLQIVQADITTLDVDVIVNAANASLSPGGGVCGAIHRAAGAELADACEDAGPCPTGEARVTPGFRLQARWVIHTVGPRWQGGGHDEDRLLASCYRSAFALVQHLDVESVAFPAISTGIYAFPLERATEIALREIVAALVRWESVPRVVCACWDEATLGVYRDVRARMGV